MGRVERTVSYEFKNWRGKGPRTVRFRVSIDEEKIDDRMATRLARRERGTQATALDGAVKITILDEEKVARGKSLFGEDDAG